MATTIPTTDHKKIHSKETEKSTEGRLLLLNSTVVSGFAGAKSCTFPIQALGIDVDAIFATQHSNHSGHRHVSRADIPRDQLASLFGGLKQNNLLQGRCDYFISEECCLHDVIDIRKDLKAANPDAKWFCDTVIGDRDKTQKEIYYCPKALVPLCRDLALPRACIITPNQLECELLSNVLIKPRQDAMQAMAALHDKGVEIIILTSVITEHGYEMLVSQIIKDENAIPTEQQQRVFRAPFEELPYHFTGTSDCTMGLILANLHKTPDDLASAASRSLSSMQAIMKRSIAALQNSECEKDDKGIELKIVQSLADIIDPPKTHLLLPI